MGHDPRNTQAVLHEVETGVNISLQDADGVFLTVKPIVVDLGKPDDPLLGKAVPRVMLKELAS